MNNKPDSFIRRFFQTFSIEWWVVMTAFSLACVGTMYFYSSGHIVAYGDAESHLNIAKRVVDSLTPGFAQLGGIWLPLPHLLLMPFVYFDFLWRTGLAGSIVSGAAYIISALYMYKLAHLITKHKGASFFAAVVFMLNANVLYLQSTPMTELTLIVFFLLSSYYFIRFLIDDRNLLMLIAAAGFGFCASLSRYDGWALVMMEAGVLFLYYFPLASFRGKRKSEEASLGVEARGKTLLDRWHLFEGRAVLFSTLALFGVIIWLVWGGLILGDPLYFTHSEFSANSQQKNWLVRGELPAYHNVPVSLLYYAVTSMEIAGVLASVLALLGLALFIFDKANKYRLYILLVLMVPFFFNVLTLFIGQSVIFIPSLTPTTFEWHLFNVRYGVMMVPVIALFAGYLFARVRRFGRTMTVFVLGAQSLLFLTGFSPALALDDGVVGLSSAIAKMPDAQFWLARNYDHGKLLTDDFARTISIVRLPISMRDVVYIGNKPYWEESLVAPEKYARWIVMQKNDAVWTHLYDDPKENADLFKYFNKTYTSENVLIFKRNDSVKAE